ncbi:hypothetical protein ERO13_D06G087300v2 [Gossypium hirsutum]|nr:hypothetical protein ERO13_D06G087300v2 [Gossypium hirsutum]
MAKSKNHTAHNQSYKAHKNGINKPKRHRHTSTKGTFIDGFQVLEELEVWKEAQQEER